ncbi:MAG: histidine kinase, partial [Pseudomonadota bacterium]
MQNILNFPKLLQLFIKKHKLYANLHALVVSMVLSVILMQTGSLFLFDYIPDHLSVIHKAYQNQAVWRSELYQLDNHFNDKKVILDRLNKSHIDFDGPIYSWAKNQRDTGLANAYEYLKTTQQNFTKIGAQESSKAVILEQGQKVMKAYDDFVVAAENDIVIKQSLMSLIQLVCLFLVFCIAAGIMMSSWSILINRLGKILAIMPEDIVAANAGHQYDDELEVLEKLTAEMSARLQAIQAETKWINKTSMEKVRKMILSQDFLFKLAKLIGSSGLSELTIKKTLYSLERTLGVANVALVFSENGSRISAQRGLFSSYWPLSFDESMFDESANPLTVNHVTKLIKGECVQCVTVPLPSPNGWLGILLLETEANHYFDDSELQLFEVTAQMLALSMGFQAREQESRRVALLEERAV